MPNEQYGYPVPPEPPRGPYGPYGPPPPGKGSSIASLVIGIVSIVLSATLILDVFLLVASIIGIVLAVSGKKRNMMAGMPIGMATAGLVLNIIGVVFNALGFLTCNAVFIPLLLFA